MINDDMKAQNQTLQEQIEVAYRTSEDQLSVNEQQAELIVR